jgi:leucyl-tRNA synthetase
VGAQDHRYADRLLDDLQLVDWPHSTLEMQRNWIGRSIGAEVEFAIDGATRRAHLHHAPDTLFGAPTWCWRPSIRWSTWSPRPTQRARSTPTASDGAQERPPAHRAGQGEDRRLHRRYAVNPVNGEPLPIWIADYVLMSYGTGAIMGGARPRRARLGIRARLRSSDSRGGGRRNVEEAAYVDLERAWR